MLKLSEIDMDNDEFKKAYDFIQNTNETFFLTGKAGTGKSTFLRYFVETSDKNCIVLAPTGIAAINAQGETIHSFFQLPKMPFWPDESGITRFKESSNKMRMIKSLDTIFIDEISLARVDLLMAIDYSLRINGGDPDKPFGGKQVILVGDDFQLPSLLPIGAPEHMILDKIYGWPFLRTSYLVSQARGLLNLKRCMAKKTLDFSAFWINFGSLRMVRTI